MYSNSREEIEVDDASEDGRTTKDNQVHREGEVRRLQKHQRLAITMAPLTESSIFAMIL